MILNLSRVLNLLFRERERERERDVFVNQGLPLQCLLYTYNQEMHT